MPCTSRTIELARCCLWQVPFLRPIGLLILLVILMVFPGVASPVEIVNKPYWIDMPVQAVEASVEFEEQTPWGVAKSKTFHGTGVDSAAIYHFMEFGFPKARPIHPAKLKQTLEYFLRHRKCVATELKQTLVLDADGNAWPQVAWEGSCAAGERYRNLRFVAHGRLYEIGVTYPMGLMGTTESTRQPAPDPDRALREFASRCRFIDPSSAE